MSSVKILNSAAEALAYAVECQIATLEWAGMLKKTSKSELERHKDITRTGLRNCKSHITVEDAHRARAYRVEEFLLGERDEIGEKIETSMSTETRCNNWRSTRCVECGAEFSTVTIIDVCIDCKDRLWEEG